MSVSINSVSGNSPVINALALAKLGNGEYSAGSVAANPVDAAKLALMKLRDGNYGTLLSASAMGLSSGASSSSSFGVQSALTNLVRGG